VEFEVDGLRVRPAGEDPLDHTSGHHHLIIDGGPIPPGQLVPLDDKHLHLGKGQTMTEYSLILGAVAVVVFVSYEAMGDHIIAKILRVADLIEDAT